MPRAARAVVICGAGLCLLSGAPVAAAPTAVVEQAGGIGITKIRADQPSGARSDYDVRTASHDPEKEAPKPKPKPADMDAEKSNDTVDQPGRAPARQVPVGPEKASAGRSGVESSGEQNDKAGDEADEAPGDADTKDVAKPSPEMKAETPEQQPEEKAVTETSPANEPVMQPGLPIRKPRKPVVRRKKASKKTSSSRSGRERQLCKALQSCRNEFRRCKAKIKHPDQSEPWIIAKEVCGSHYKTCVEKDFRSGEWTFTRWFYFQDLNCK